MAQFPTEPPTSTSSAKAPPDLLPAAWVIPGAPPLEIDVGCHKGLFLVEMAARYPAHNFFGIECQSDRVARTRKKIQSASFTNAGVTCGDGLEVMRQLPANSADWIHVLFPDPWPKRRHHSRRLVQRRFLEACDLVLKSCGTLRLVTDDAAYAVAMRETVAEFGRFTPATDGREYPLTEFQKKFRADGREVYAMTFGKAPPGS